MKDIGSLLLEVETKGNWSEEDVQRYLQLSSEEETLDYGAKSSINIRAYKTGDEIEDLVDRIGNYDIQELFWEGYQIQVIEESGKVCGMIAIRNDGDSRYIGAVAVGEEFEGRGFMGSLVDSVYGGFPLTAKVHSSNVHAREAFHKYGFRSGNILNDWVEMSRS